MKELLSSSPSSLFRAGPVKAIADTFDHLPGQVGASVMVMKFLVHWDSLLWQFCWHFLGRLATGQWTRQLRCSSSSRHLCLQCPLRHFRLQSWKHICLQCLPLHSRSQVPLLQVCVQFLPLQFKLHVPCSLLQVCSQYCPEQVCEHCPYPCSSQVKVVFVWPSTPSSALLPEKLKNFKTLLKWSQYTMPYHSLRQQLKSYTNSICLWCGQS